MVIVVENQSFRDEIVDNFKKDLKYNDIKKYLIFFFFLLCNSCTSNNIVYLSLKPFFC